MFLMRNIAWKFEKKYVMMNVQRWEVKGVLNLGK